MGCGVAESHLAMALPTKTIFVDKQVALVGVETFPLALGPVHITAFDMCVFGRWLHLHREIESFLSLCLHRPLRKTQTTASGVNQPLDPCASISKETNGMQATLTYLTVSRRPGRQRDSHSGERLVEVVVVVKIANLLGLFQLLATKLQNLFLLKLILSEYGSVLTID